MTKAETAFAAWLVENRERANLYVDIGSHELIIRLLELAFFSGAVHGVNAAKEEFRTNA